MPWTTFEFAYPIPACAAFPHGTLVHSVPQMAAKAPCSVLEVTPFLTVQVMRVWLLGPSFYPSLFPASVFSGASLVPHAQSYFLRGVAVSPPDSGTGNVFLIADSFMSGARDCDRWITLWSKESCDSCSWIGGLVPG